MFGIGEYSRHIDMLKKNMDESAQPAENIRNDIFALDTRYAIVEPGERSTVANIRPCQGSSLFSHASMPTIVIT
ncbi:hypothetical protein BGX38DRAFT_1199663 [Terfezia claveryi]|nr:hypothetical protein BGX38DRAFT_1199663 [Terfezia claveryi]